MKFHTTESPSSVPIPEYSVLPISYSPFLIEQSSINPLTGHQVHLSNPNLVTRCSHHEETWLWYFKLQTPHCPDTALTQGLGQDVSTVSWEGEVRLLYTYGVTLASIGRVNCTCMYLESRKSEHCGKFVHLKQWTGAGYDVANFAVWRQSGRKCLHKHINFVINSM